MGEWQFHDIAPSAGTAEPLVRNGLWQDTVINAISVAPGAVTILLVEDEHQLLEELADFFTCRGCAVATAGTVAGARDLLRSGAGEWRVLSDMRLPDASGLELVAAIQNDPELARRVTRIALMTGHLELDNQISRHFQATGVETLLKPVQLSALTTLITP